MRTEAGIRVVHVITGTDLGGAENMLDKLLSVLSPEFDCTVVSLMPLGPVAARIRARSAAPVTLSTSSPARP